MRTPLFVMLLALISSQVCGAQKPIVEQLIFSDGTAPPNSLQAMMQQADVVVVATYVGQSRLIPRPDGLPLDSIHTFTIVEVLKFSAGVRGAGDVFEIQLTGGVKEYADRIERMSKRGRSTLHPDRSYVVFLRWIPGRPNAELLEMWASGSIYDITAGRVQALEQESPRFQGRDAASFLAEARNVR